jgi:hypothetical protein
MSNSTAPTRQSRRQVSSDNAPNFAPVSRHLHPSPIDANTVLITRLTDAVSNITSNRDFLSQLDFVNITDEKLRLLFYNPARHSDRCFDADGSFIFPPKALRRNYKDIKAFFERGAVQKCQLLNEYGHHTIDTSNSIKYSDSVYCNDGKESIMMTALLHLLCRLHRI